MWYLYTMKYYWTTKGNKIMPSAETQMQTETVLQSEVNQKQKTNTI